METKDDGYEKFTKQADLPTKSRIKTHRKNLGRQFLEEYFLPSISISFMVIVIHVEGLDIEL